jgi:hypothetical protein
MLLFTVHVVDLIPIDLVLLCHLEVTYFKYYKGINITQIGKIHTIQLEIITHLLSSHEIWVC